MPKLGAGRLKKPDIAAIHKLVRERFGHRCVLCGRPRSGHVHEIEPRSKRPLDWDDAENMMNLCGSCHDYVHTVGTAKCADILLIAAARRH